jgi:hypothetical protein
MSEENRKFISWPVKLGAPSHKLKDYVQNREKSEQDQVETSLGNQLLQVTR